MTIICIDAFGTIAADGRACCDGIITSERFQKIRVFPGKAIYAFAGDAALRDPLIEWHLNGAVPGDAPKGGSDDIWELVVIDRSSIAQYTHQCVHPDDYQPPWAWGSEWKIGLGLLLAGKTAAEAVRIVCDKTIKAGGEIQIVNIAEALGVQPVREAAE